MPERVLKGRPAAPGFASGPVHRLVEVSGSRVALDDPAAEEAALRAAIASALAAIEAMMREVGREAADVLGFQAALLSDEDLARPAYESIRAGLPADIAWQTSVATQIAAHLSGGDEDDVPARLADVEDLRDRVLEALWSRVLPAALPPGAVIVARDMPPSRFLAVDWSAGGAVVLAAGSPSSHVAVLARSRGVPMIVGLGPDIETLSGEVLVDGAAGEVVAEPGPRTRAAHAARRDEAERERAAAAAVLDRPAATRDGTAVRIMLTVDDPADLASVDRSHCDGIGLVRTEFLFQGRSALPGEEAQFGVYRTIAEWAAGRPVMIRTLDAGGDKPIPGVTLEGEPDPFLGLRGVRLSLTRPDLFRVQLRALLRAAAYGDVRIMLPMVTVPAELAAVRALLDEEEASLRRAKRPYVRPPLGMMVEVPAAAIAIDLFDAAFLSIGTNDLAQYVAAAGRSGAAAHLADPLHPALLRLVAAVAAHGATTGRETGLCGDAAADPALIPALLRAGVRSLSVPPAALGRVKLAVAAVDLTARH